MTVPGGAQGPVDPVEPVPPAPPVPAWGTPQPGFEAPSTPRPEWDAEPAATAPADVSVRQPPGQPLGQPGAPLAEPVLVTIGDIACTQSEVITPAGREPIGSVVWTFTDLSSTVRVTPTWAIVMAVAGFVFCLLGLLFLLVKETRTTGLVQVTVTGARLRHQVNLPVASLSQVADYGARVSYAQSLSARR